MDFLGDGPPLTRSEFWGCGLRAADCLVSKEKTSAGENDTLICMVRVFFWGGRKRGERDVGMSW